VRDLSGNRRSKPIATRLDVGPRWRGVDVTGDLYRYDFWWRGYGRGARVRDRHCDRGHHVPSPMVHPVGSARRTSNRALDRLQPMVAMPRVVHGDQHHSRAQCSYRANSSADDDTAHTCLTGRWSVRGWDRVGRRLRCTAWGSSSGYSPVLSQKTQQVLRHNMIHGIIYQSC
jgi:hypothetical protein